LMARGVTRAVSTGPARGPMSRSCVAAPPSVPPPAPPLAHSHTRVRGGGAGALVMVLGMVAGPARTARAQDLLYLFTGGGPMFPAPPLLHPTASPGFDVLAGAV